jgi:hypothetical protein
MAQPHPPTHFIGQKTEIQQGQGADPTSHKLPLEEVEPKLQKPSFKLIPLRGWAFPNLNEVLACWCQLITSQSPDFLTVTAQRALPADGSKVDPPAETDLPFTALLQNWLWDNNDHYSSHIDRWLCTTRVSFLARRQASWGQRLVLYSHRIWTSYSHSQCFSFFIGTLEEWNEILCMKS